jgi:hypothetical protein
MEASSLFWKALLSGTGTQTPCLGRERPPALALGGLLRNWQLGHGLKGCDGAGCDCVWLRGRVKARSRACK